MWKATWRFIRSWICHNHKTYYSLMILNALAIQYVIQTSIVSYYQRRNYERSLPFAIQREQEWLKNKPAEEEEEYGDDEEGGDE